MEFFSWCRTVCKVCRLPFCFCYFFVHRLFNIRWCWLHSTFLHTVYSSDQKLMGSSSPFLALSLATVRFLLLFSTSSRLFCVLVEPGALFIVDINIHPDTHTRAQRIHTCTAAHTKRKLAQIKWNFLWSIFRFFFYFTCLHHRREQLQSLQSEIKIYDKYEIMWNPS